MIYRTYGSTGIKVSAIGFGGMRFDEKNLDSCAALVKAAYDADINYFDTAPGYGESEKIFGAAFKQMKKSRSHRPFCVSTKSMKAEPQQVRKDLETSLKRMNLDYIDFYHFWYVLSFDEYHRRKANGVLKEFERLKNEGLIRHICVSTHMTGPDIGKMLRDYPFEGVLLGYSVMNFAYREAALVTAAKLNLGVVVMNPLGGGDSFASGLIYGLMENKTPEQAVNYGAAHGALAMTTPGDTTTASLAEVEKVIKGAGARVDR